MSEWGYVIAGWSVVVGGLAAYAASVVLRGRRLAPRVAPGRRRWMESSGG